MQVLGSKRESILLRGWLKGMGCEVSCSLVAVKVSLPELDIWEYVRCEIYEAPSALPDGRYDVTFDGRAMDIKKLDGNWLAGEI
jgi:hypothetical protein